MLAVKRLALALLLLCFTATGARAQRSPIHNLKAPAHLMFPNAAVYYVRTDGGFSQQCTGLGDAAYPGNGTGQSCAWSHPFWALNTSGQWRIQGGDSLIIGAGSYRMGVGAPNTETWCDSAGPWTCHLPPLPSGPNSSNPTSLLGAGWNSGCGTRPELWGTERADEIIDLTGSSNVVIDCLEITDHSDCALDHCIATVRCNRTTPPYGDYADVGILASNSSNVTLRNLNIHGLGSGGIQAARLTDWLVQDVRLTGNGQAGWNGDLGTNSSNSGTITFRRVTVDWNGCPETYPGKQPGNCWGQETCGGYGDGVGTGRTGGNWVIEDSQFRYNVSDGLDLLYVGADNPNATVVIRNSMAYGNAGSQFKIGGASQLVNSVAVSNCAYFFGQPFAAQMGGLSSGDHCRAGGAAIAISLPRGKTASIANCTIASQGWATLETQCNRADFADQPACNGTERLTMQNNAIQGYQVVYLGYARQSDFIGDGDLAGFTTTSSVDYDVIYNTEISSPTGTHTLHADPLFRSSSINSFDGRLRTASPAIDSGIAVGSLSGLIPSTDITGFSRPYGSGVDRGAYEWWLVVSELNLPIIQR